MELGLRIRTKGLTKLAGLTQNLKKMPSEMGEATYQFAKLYEKNLKLELKSRDLIWGGNLLYGIKAVKISDKSSGVEMPLHGFALDHMRPHWVSLKKGTIIREWALTKGNAAVKKIALRQGAIRVVPHPFIGTSYLKSLNKLNSIFERRIRNALTV